MRTSKGEHCWLHAPHLPQKRALLVLGLLVGLGVAAARSGPLGTMACGEAGGGPEHCHKETVGVDLRCSCKKVSACSSHRLSRCHRGVGADQRRCHEMQALPVAAAAMALAKGTASVELAGRVKRTTTAKPKARQGMGRKPCDKTRCGLCHKGVSMCSGHCLRCCNDRHKQMGPFKGKIGCQEMHYKKAKACLRRYCKVWV